MAKIMSGRTLVEMDKTPGRPAAHTAIGRVHVHACTSGSHWDK